jgi:hypothetical protein
MTTAGNVRGVEACMTTTKRVGRGKAAVELTITRTEPTGITAVDETGGDEPTSHLRPVDTGKVKTDILPGLSLIRYSRGYYVLEQKGKAYSGQKTTLRRVLYRDDIRVLVEALFTAGQDAKTYDEAHDIQPEAVPF